MATPMSGTRGHGDTGDTGVGDMGTWVSGTRGHGDRDMGTWGTLDVGN